MKSITEDAQGNTINISELDSEDVQDINTAASAIKKRSDGLLEFVKDYRTIASVPTPKLERVNVNTFMSSIEILMKDAIEEAGIDLIIAPIPINTTIEADYKLIEQVCINLINNSIHALQGVLKPIIKIHCTIDIDKTLITFTDNGKGIEEEIINQIFIPFYTTKKNGSGIGLSLSKNILKKHGGNLLVSSEPGAYTAFSLVFKN